MRLLISTLIPQVSSIFQHIFIKIYLFVQLFLRTHGFVHTQFHAYFSIFHHLFSHILSPTTFLTYNLQNLFLFIVFTNRFYIMCYNLEKFHIISFMLSLHTLLFFHGRLGYNQSIQQALWRSSYVQLEKMLNKWYSDYLEISDDIHFFWEHLLHLVTSNNLFDLFYQCLEPCEINVGTDLNWNLLQSVFL